MMVESLTWRSVETRAVRVPLRRPIVSRVGSFDTWPLILIDLHTCEGIIGRSYLEPYLDRAARYIVPAIEDLAALRAGSMLQPLSDFQENRRALQLVGYEGIAMIAAAGLDMAAWDALAKAAGLPLARLLGSSPGPVAAYNSNGLWLGTPVRELGAQAIELLAEGATGGLKLRLGRERLEDDLLAIRSVRDAVGADVKLMVDFNQGLTLGDALHRCHALDDQGLFWFEEPIAYGNLDGHAKLARELRTPVQLGENFYGPRDLMRALQAGACDFVMPDLMRIGGVSGWLRSVPLAATAGVDVSSHLYPEFSAHLLRATETAHCLEWQDWAYPILQNPFELKNGCLQTPDVPGCGIDWDEAAVRRYRYDA